MKAGILTIGDEVSSGQILNRNAGWLASHLEDLKFEVPLHITTQDKPKQIKRALAYLEESCDLIFTTGGLGPTSDDLSRHAISEWLDKDLDFDDNSWQRIIHLFEERGIELADSNRQQCFFPKGAKILTNHAGTANGFYSHHTNKNKHLWVLPGPPREIQAIWKDHIEKDLIENHRVSTNRVTLHKWQCLGKSESSLAEIVEKAIEGSGLRSGYRPHIPYVEVKIWSQDDRRDQDQFFLKKLESAISTWVVSKGNEDVKLTFLSRLGAFDFVRIIDLGTKSYLASKLGKAAREDYKGDLEHITIISEWDVQTEGLNEVLEEATNFPDEHTLTLGISSISDNGKWQIGWSFGDDIRIEELSLPYRGQKFSSDRTLNHQAEASIIAWNRIIQNRVN